MTGWRSVAALALAGVLVAPAAYAAGDDPVPSRRLFTIDGDEIFESSGLVDTDQVVYTVNDSGRRRDRLRPRPGLRPDGQPDDVRRRRRRRGGTRARVPTARCGPATSATTRQRRDDVTVYHLDPRDGEHRGTPYTLTYPDGPHDAETLLVHPRTGRVFVVSKSVFGGTVYAAPRDLAAGGRTNRLASVRPGLGTGHGRVVLPRRAARAAAHLRHRVGLHVPRLRAGRHRRPAGPAAGRGHLASRRRGGCWSPPRACAPTCCGSTSPGSHGGRPRARRRARPARHPPPGRRRRFREQPRDRPGAPPRTGAGSRWSPSWWRAPATSRGTGTRPPPRARHDGPTTAPDVDNGVAWPLPVGLSRVVAALLLLLYRLVWC